MMYHQYRLGYVEVITGCMFAGKTEELIRRINVLEFAKQKVLVFKPEIDNRYSETSIVSHGGASVTSTNAKDAQAIYEYCTEHPDYDVIAIDEIQFYDDDIILVIEELARMGKRVMVAGLDTDFRGEPFGVMPKLLTMSEFVTKLTAVCVKCGSPATRTQRLVNGEPANYNDPIILVGASEAYEARCRHCHEIEGKPRYQKKGL